MRKPSGRGTNTMSVGELARESLTGSANDNYYELNAVWDKLFVVIDDY